MIGAFAVDNFAFSQNGGAIGTDLSGTIPAGLTTLRVGRTSSATAPFYGRIKQVALFGMRPSNADLPTYSAL